MILSEPLVALLCSNYDDVKTLRASGRHNYSSRRRGARPSYAFETTSRPRNWCVTVDDIEAAPLRNGIRELVPCRADQTGRPVRQESKRSSKLVKRRDKQKLCYMDRTQAPPNLEFFPESVRRLWKGKSEDQILQSAAFSIACLMTGPVACQPRDCTYDGSALYKAPDGAVRTRKKKRRVAGNSEAKESA